MRPVSGQCSRFRPPENNRKPLFSGVFRGCEIGALARNGLIHYEAEPRNAVNDNHVKNQGKIHRKTLVAKTYNAMATTWLFQQPTT